ncbi:hypothetical protein [Rubinisphaera margarita]|uniref:hypothetical protein n=1 Tax=Rubinisphaera margarita TaxID=2909586 RepID=UPI001EE8CEAC|nr:hypothetical protein [Rubinisphaera margarita]MCG6158341.1 hypothetical protein [Rubinisphaera margarita]
MSFVRLAAYIVDTQADRIVLQIGVRQTDRVQYGHAIPQFDDVLTPRWLDS